MLEYGFAAEQSRTAELNSIVAKLSPGALVGVIAWSEAAINFVHPESRS